MDCPVCLKDAKDASPLAYRGLVVECSRCGIYRVTQNAIAALRSLKPEERMAALQMAKTVGSRGAPTVTSAFLQRFPTSTSPPPRMRAAYDSYLWQKVVEGNARTGFSGWRVEKAAPNSPGNKPKPKS
jgi:hypothetical protein